MRLIKSIEDAISDFYTKTGLDPTIIYLGFRTYDLLSLEVESWTGYSLPPSLKVVPSFRGIKYEILKETPYHIGVGIDYSPENDGETYRRR